MSFNKKTLLLGLTISGLLAGIGSEAWATDIVNDGSAAGVAGKLSPSDKIYSIAGSKESNIGRADGNLLFSFSTFNLSKGDTAQYSCTGCPATNNIITRVTGNSLSTLDGTINYSGDASIANANFWFFNPNGVVIGKNASFDVPAALHISSGSELRDSSGKVIIDKAARPSTLTAATPANFGFLNATGHISIENGKIVNATTLASAGNLFNNGEVTATVTAQGDIINDTNVTDRANNKVTITGAVTAGGKLLNRGVIIGNVSADTDLINNGTITGDAEAKDNLVNNTNLLNSNDPAIQINGNVSAKIITNRGSIIGNVTAQNTLSNDGTMTGNAESGANITNKGSITGNASASTTLTNWGSIGTAEKNNVAKAGTNFVNNGSIFANTTAVKNLTNSGTITGNAKSGADLTNNGTITGTVQATAGKVLNTNTINGNVIAKNALTNDGTITGNATAGTDLTNNGTINGNAKATSGDLVNNKAGQGTDAASATDDSVNLNVAITGNATAGGKLDNWGKIGGKAESVGQLSNHIDNVTLKPDSTELAKSMATISGGAESTGGDIVNDGTISGSFKAKDDKTYTALAATNLTNNGSITGDAIATSGQLVNGSNTNKDAKISGTASAGLALDNYGTIDGKATSGTDSTKPKGSGKLTNYANATIKGGAESKNDSDIQNDGTISGTFDKNKNKYTLWADNKLINNGTINGRYEKTKEAIVSYKEFVGASSGIKNAEKKDRK